MDSEILHGGEGGDVERGSNLRTNFFVYDLLSLFTCLSFIILVDQYSSQQDSN